MKKFDPRTAYRYDDDVRKQFAAELAELMHDHHPQGAYWPLIGPRRSGKTWTLHAVKHALGGKGTEAQLVVIDGHEKELPAQQKTVVLVDEPGRWLGKGKQPSKAKGKQFFAWCAAGKERGIKIMVAMSPGEYEFLSQFDEPNHRKDRGFIRGLTPDEGFTMASWAKEWAPKVFEQLDPAWQRHAFLLELALQQAQLRPDLCDDIAKLLAAAVNATHAHKYRQSVFEEGLSHNQRETIRNVGWEREEVTADECELLVGCGLVERGPQRHRLLDPILRAHLPPPLRIHHLSDIHFGEKSARVVDVKARGSYGKSIGGGAGGEQLARDIYLNHIAGPDEHKPHLVVISGDIAERGEKELYDEFLPWLEQLRKNLADHPDFDAMEPRILVVGGNHDVDWGQTIGPAGAQARHVPFAESLKDLPRPKLEVPPGRRPVTTVVYPKARVAFCLLGSAEFGGEQEQDEAWQRVVDAVDQLRAEADELIKQEKLAESSKLLDKLGRVDPGLVHYQDIDRLKATKLLEKVCIAVLHHPVSPLPFTEVAHFSGTINAGALKDALMARQYCLVLHGHMHMGWFAEERWPDRHKDWTLRIAAAGSLGSKEKDEQHSFNEIVVIREGDACAVTVHRLVRNNDQFRRDKSMGPFSPGK